MEKLSELLELLFILPAILISITIHEFAHGYVAYKLGDPTAKNMGRLTLNPLKHIDPVGTLMLVIARFGWAKPVPINPMYFKNVKKGTMLVGIAGPLSNIIFAIFLKSILYISVLFFNGNWVLYFIGCVNLMYFLNINLAVFNLIPIPPLDGAKIFGGLLPNKWYYDILVYEKYVGIILVLIIFMFPQLLNKIMGPITALLDYGIEMLLMPLAKIVTTNLYG